VSRPGSFTPAPLRTVREPLDSYRSRHPNLMALLQNANEQTDRLKK